MNNLVNILLVVTLSVASASRPFGLPMRELVPPAPEMPQQAPIVPKQQFDVNYDKLPKDLDEIYNKVQSFFNSIFESANVELVYKSMGILTGEITHSEGDQVLFGTHIMTVVIQDISLMDAPSTVLAKSVNILTDSNQFPLKFSIQVNTRLFQPYGKYSLSVRIEKNGALRYINDYSIPVTDDNNKLLSFPILVNVIKTFTYAAVDPDTNSLSGFIMPKKSNPNALYSIEDNSFLEVIVIDRSIADKPAVTLGKYQTLLRNQFFPIQYNVRYNKYPLEDFKAGTYSVSVRITKNGELTYITDEVFQITDSKGYPLKAVNVTVKPMFPVVETIPVQNLTANKSITIKGQILHSKNLMNPVGYAEITIQDVSLADAPSVRIASKNIPLRGIWSFPLDYEIQFDPSDIIANPWKSISISARITKMPDNLLSYISDTSIDLIDHNTKSIKKTIDIPVIRLR